jgi:hypothetical protein
MEMRSNQNFNGFQALVTVREIKDVNIMLSQSHDQHASGSMLHDLVMHTYIIRWRRMTCLMTGSSAGSNGMLSLC